MPQAQAFGQVVAGHGREGYAGHQSAQPRQALHGLDVDHQADRAALAQRCRLAPGLMLSPASGDELAQRLGLKHYPVLITATGIEP